MAPAPATTVPPVETVGATPSAVPLATSAALPVGLIGERVESAGVGLTVKGVSQSGSINDFLVADEGKVYVVADVLIENARPDTEISYNVLYFVVKDSEGFEYNPQLVGPDPALGSGDLVAGDLVRGNVALEVPQAAAGIIMTFDAFSLFDDEQPIRFDLGNVSDMADLP